jgi:hypothetical protein
MRFFAIDGAIQAEGLYVYHTYYMLEKLLSISAPVRSQGGSLVLL